MNYIPSKKQIVTLATFSFGLGLVFCSLTILGQPVYKSVDEQGNVTYSNTPPETAKQVEKVDIKPGPSKQNTEDSQQSLETTKATAKQMEKDRKSREIERNKQREAAAKEAEKFATPEESQKNYGSHYPIYQQPIVRPRPPRPPPSAGNPPPAGGGDRPVAVPLPATPKAPAARPAAK